MNDVHALLQKLLTTMNISFESIDIGSDEFGNPSFVVKTNDSNLLIGPGGENFKALNYLLKRMAAKERGEEQVHFFLDINNYQSKNINALKTKALVLAERVKSFKTSVQMDPMSSYERMIVHSLFAENSSIKTESEGEGRNRRVVIKYISSPDESFTL